MQAYFILRRRRFIARSDHFTMRFRRAHSALCLGAALFLARGAQAEAVRLHGGVAAAHAITGYQKDEFGWGPAGLVALELPLNKLVGLQLQLDTLWLAQAHAQAETRGRSRTATLELRTFRGDR